MNKNIIIVAIISALVFGAGGFVGGVVYQKSKAVVNNFRQGNGFGGEFGQRMGGNRNGSMMGNRPVLGQVVSKDDKSITVKIADGSTKIVLLSSSTTVSKTDVGQVSDIKVGETVNIFGVTNSDGTVTASNVLLNPAFRGATNSALPRYN